MCRKVATKSPTSTNGRGDADSLLNVSDNAMPVVRTAQLVVVSRRVRQTVLSYRQILVTAGAGQAAAVVG